MPNPKARNWFLFGYRISQRLLNEPALEHWAVIMILDVVVAGLGLIVNVGANAFGAAFARIDECKNMITNMRA